MTTRDKSYWRRKGEQDRANNRGYHSPHGLWSDLTTWTIAGIRRAREENQAYHLGWSRGTSRGLE